VSRSNRPQKKNVCVGTPEPGLQTVKCLNENAGGGAAEFLTVIAIAPWALVSSI
jgi:hypothetical protein